MRTSGKILFMLALFLWFSAKGNCLEIQNIILGFSERHPIVTVFFKDLPFQELVLSLKAQKNPVYINYTFEIYRKRLFLRDVLLHKELYTQKFYYDPEENLYFLEDNSCLRKFERPEEAFLRTYYLDSYPLKFSIEESRLEDLYLKISVDITYKTHLSKDLRYTQKERKVSLKAERSVPLKKE